MKNLIKYLVLYVPILGIFIVMFKTDFIYIKDKYGNRYSTLSSPLVFFTSALFQAFINFFILYELLWDK